MASRQFQLDDETYVNADDNDREFQVSTETFFLEEVAADPPTPPKYYRQHIGFLGG